MAHKGIIITFTFAIHRAAGAHRIATHLRQQGWDCEVVDFGECWDLDEFQALIDSRADSDLKFLGFSFLFNHSSSAPVIRQLCEWVREKYPTIALISGGQTVSIDEALFDYHVAGYGEWAIEALLKYLFSNGERPRFDILRSTKTTKFIDALHSYPAYPFKDPIISYEPRDFIAPHEWGMIEFARGCIFKCLFCNYPVLGVKEDHTRDADGVREQMMRNYDDYGIENYVISDETFNDRSDKIVKFADVIETLPWKPYMTAYIRADLLVSRRQDWEHLSRMGLYGHFYGVETFNHEAGKAIGKGMNPDKLKQGLVEAKQFFNSASGNKYRAMISLIAGLPHETLESLRETSSWVRKHWIDQSVTANVLEIAKHELDFRPSDLSLDYGKYGYRLYVEDDPVVQAAFMEMNHSSSGSISWENDNMNIIQASEWVKEVSGIWMIGNHDLSKLDPFFLPNCYATDGGKLLSLDEKLKLTHSTASQAIQRFDVFVTQYKNKKIAYGNK